MRNCNNKGRRYDPVRRWGCLGLMVYIMAMIGLLAIMLCSCSRTEYVPVESVRTEYRDREVEKIVSDTIHDTRLVWIKGDTMIDIREKERIKRVEIHDTCYMERIDSIRAPYPVEKKLTRWEQAKMDFGGFALGGFAVVLCISVAWLIRKFRK